METAGSGCLAPADANTANMHSAIAKLREAADLQGRMLACPLKLRGAVEPEIDVGAYAYAIFCKKYEQVMQLHRKLNLSTVETLLRDRKPVHSWVLDEIAEFENSGTEIDYARASAFIFKRLAGIS